MKKFILRELKTENLYKELSDIGFDNSYIENITNKYKYKNIKLYGLSVPQANILKQTALSVGADCATPRGVITGEIDTADCILGGSISQLTKIAVKLGLQPFGLRNLGRDIENLLSITESSQKTPEIMGILNITDNSFSDGGKYNNYDAAVKHLNQMIEEGADIIDIGAESTKPGSNSISPKIQLDRLLPILEYISHNDINIPISIDTRSSHVAQECIKYGISYSDITFLMLAL